VTEMNNPIKNFVINSINYRSNAGPIVNPSIYWTDFAKNIRYVYDLDCLELERIRFHTYHLTSDSYLTYYFANLAYKTLLDSGYKYFVRLGQLQLIEEGCNGIGVETAHGKISHDLLRYMGLAADLFSSQTLTPDSSKHILEIGGGYGGLARMVIVNSPKSSYFICDLEETIFFSATYLRNNFGSERVHLIDSPLFDSDVQEGHFYIVPQSRIDHLDNLHFELVISQQSLQEMTNDQVQRYCTWIQGKADEFYSCNLPDHAEIAIEKGLVQKLPDIFRSYFGLPKWIGAYPGSDSSYGDNHLPRSLYHCGSKV
jgi:hypothetical protein